MQEIGQILFPRRSFFIIFLPILVIIVFKMAIKTLFFRAKERKRCIFRENSTTF